VQIDPSARINVEDGYIGDRSIIRHGAVIEGRSIRIGNEAWIDEYAHIGGGSCHDPTSSLEAGDFLHMGKFSHLNQGRGLKIGHEFGCGINTRIFTHGAYLSAWDGFPVQWGSVTIGDRVWMPNAWVNPKLRVGNDIVVAAMSLVNSDLPDGCLAGGIPCKVLKEGAYPRRLSAKEKGDLFDMMFSDALVIHKAKSAKDIGKVAYERLGEDTFSTGGTVFDIGKRVVEGPASEFAETLKNQLRRNGIRFRYCAQDGRYVKW